MNGGTVTSRFFTPNGSVILLNSFLHVEAAAAADQDRFPEVAVEVAVAFTGLACRHALFVLIQKLSTHDDFLLRRVVLNWPVTDRRFQEQYLHVDNIKPFSKPYHSDKRRVK